MLNDAPAVQRGAALDALQDACVWIEPGTGTILDCNPALPRLMGLRRDQLVGQPVTAFAHSTEVITNATWLALLAGHPVRDADIRIRRQGGAVLDLSASVSPLCGPDGGIHSILSVWCDISQRHRSEPSLQQRADEVRALAYEVTMAETRERERVAQGLHDEIGQSLALVSLKLDELNMTLTDASSAALVEELKGLVVQATRATRSATFDLSCPVLQQLGLRAALESLAKRMQRLYGLQVHLKLDLPDASMPQAIRQIVFRVVRELLYNVHKHAGARSAWIRQHHHNHRVVFLVWDDGVGFDPHVQDRRFGPEGGFGLFSAQAQMLAIGGRLEVDSAPGHGTWATVTVPGSLA